MNFTESKLEPSFTAAGQQWEGGEGRELHLAQLRELGFQWRPPRRPAQRGHGQPGGARPSRDHGPHPELQQRARWF